MINVMFCILRNACAEQDQTFAIDQNVNIVLYEYQKRFAVDPQMGKKAFVYQTNNKIIVQDFGDVDKNSIFFFIMWIFRVFQRMDIQRFFCNATRIFRFLLQK